jgi:hypothetical protein
MPIWLARVIGLLHGLVHRGGGHEADAKAGQPMAASERYQFETQLREPVAQWLRDVHPNVVLADEVGPRYAPTDLVAGVPGSLDDRLASRVVPLDNRDQLELLGFLATPRAQTELRARFGGRSWAGLQADLIAPLAEAGVIGLDADGRWLTEVIPPSPFEEIFTVELKLSNWRKALRQAALHQLFANRAHIAMPADRIGEPLTLECHRLGLGLLAVDTDGTVDPAVEPRNADPVDPLEARAVGETLLADQLGLRGPVAPAGSPRPRTGAVLVGAS